MACPKDLTLQRPWGAPRLLDTNGRFLRQYLIKLFYHCFCPPARDLGSRLSDLVSHGHATTTEKKSIQTFPSRSCSSVSFFCCSSLPYFHGRYFWGIGPNGGHVLCKTLIIVHPSFSSSIILPHRAALYHTRARGSPKIYLHRSGKVGFFSSIFRRRIEKDVGQRRKKRGVGKLA